MIQKQSDIYTALAAVLPGLAGGYLLERYLAGQHRGHAAEVQRGRQNEERTSGFEQSRMGQTQEGLTPLRATALPNGGQLLSRGGLPPVVQGPLMGPSLDGEEKLSAEMQATAWEAGRQLARDMLEKQAFTFSGAVRAGASGLKQLGGAALKAPQQITDAAVKATPWQLKAGLGVAGVGAAYGAYKAMDTAKSILGKPEAGPHAHGFGPPANVNEFGAATY